MGKLKLIKHDLKLFIINNPKIRQNTIALEFGVSPEYVCSIYKELNIQPNKKPYWVKL